MYKSMNEIQPHNNELGIREMDMLISMIAKVPLTDQVRLNTINEAIYYNGGTVAMALVVTVYNSFPTHYDN